MKKSNIIIVSIATVLLIINIILYQSMPKIELKGNNVEEVLVNTSYIDPGFTLKGKGKVEVIDNTNYKKIGDYEITYKTKYLFMNIEAKRIIKIIDNQSPIITLNGTDVKVCPNKEYEELGFKAIDNYDGDITDKVKITKYDNKITYEVKDSSNNLGTITRNIKIVDDEVPIINLNGNKVMTIYVGNKFTEPGYNASDNCDEDITNKVEVSGYVNTNVAGTYKKTYKVSDLSGNTTSVTRTIIVKKYKEANGKIIYLTFDDGPTSITNKILDVLKEENVKATFFVAGYPNTAILKREYNEGHTIALHTATHDYKTVYSSVDAYFNDLNTISKRVYNAVGFEPKIIRFPGGSSNTVSRNYSKGIMTTLTREVQNRGYTYFDWNVSSGDASSIKYSADGIYNNVINGIRNNKESIVLMHDLNSKTSTLGALRNIIRYGKENGYEFRRITEDTRPVHHGVNN